MMYKTIYICIYILLILVSITAITLTETKATVKMTWLSTDQNNFLYLLRIFLHNKYGLQEIAYKQTFYKSKIQGEKSLEFYTVETSIYIFTI